MAGPERPFVPPTVVMPNPGGARPRFGGEPQPGPAAGAFSGPRTPLVDSSTAKPGVNPLVDAASDLFDLIVYLQPQASAVDLPALREKALVLIRRFETRRDGRHRATPIWWRARNTPWLRPSTTS
jgi:type VI protein secretion system component VasF